MNEAWESLGRAADLQKRLDTIGRRMVPGSLAGSTETASLPSPLPPVANHGLEAASSPLVVASDRIDTLETTTSLSWTDLATVGPTVSLFTAERVLVSISGYLKNSTATEGSYMGFAVSGATSRAVQLGEAIVFEPLAAGDALAVGRTCVVDGLTPGVNTFTAKYMVGGTSTGTFLYRHLWVMVL